MNVKLIKVSSAELQRDRERLHLEVGMGLAELRDRVTHEIATEHERAVYERLKEISFLLDEDS